MSVKINAGAKILDGLRDAVSGNFAAVTIEGQRWVRAPEWRPIETAPIGATPNDKILVGFMGQFSWMPFVAYPNGSATSHPGYAKPTHWQPLPEPPVQP